MSIDLTRFHESFFTESLEALDATEAHLLTLEAERGEPAADSVERVNAIFRAVAVPPGKYTVRFTFEPLRGAWRELREKVRGR